MSKLQTFGIISDTYANSTRLKDRIVGYFPDMIAVCKGHGHETLLMFDKILPIRSIRLASLILDGMHLVRVVQIVRREMFNSERSFTGTFQMTMKLILFQNHC